MIEIDSKFEPGLKDSLVSHILVVSHLHLEDPGDLVVIPFLDTESRGIFYTRAPRRRTLSQFQCLASKVWLVHASMFWMWISSMARPYLISNHMSRNSTRAPTPARVGTQTL
jgi:hypothetical protein